MRPPLGSWAHCRTTAPRSWPSQHNGSIPYPFNKRGVQRRSRPTHMAYNISALFCASMGNLQHSYAHECSELLVMSMSIFAKCCDTAARACLRALGRSSDPSYSGNMWGVRNRACSADPLGVTALHHGLTWEWLGVIRSGEEPTSHVLGHALQKAHAHQNQRLTGGRRPGAAQRERQRSMVEQRKRLEH